MAKIIGKPLPNIPWQDPPAVTRTPLWRYDGNPIIGRDGNKRSNSVFNSAVVPYGDGFAGVFRCDSLSISMDIFAGFSKDGIHWTIDDETFHQLENAFLPYNRNGVLFPRKIQGRYMMMSRPSDTGHTPFGDIFVSQSEDMIYWGRHRYMMGAVKGDESAWQSLKIGPGPIPIETDEGWLLIYHGVIMTCNGYVYRMGAALLDINEPWKVLARGKDYILAPHMPYECMGDVPNVTFPCAALADADTGRIAVYYGCADTVTGLAFTTVDRVLNYIKANSF